MPSLDDIAAGIAMGLLDSSSLMTAAAARMRCRRHDAPVVALGPRGGLCVQCAAEDYPPPPPPPPEDVTAPLWERAVVWWEGARR